MSDDFRQRVLVVDDEEFTRTVVSESLVASNLIVRSACSVADALSEVASFDPHAVVTDLDLGPGPNGLDLLYRVSAERPWIGMVILTSHQSAELAVGRRAEIPDGAVYLVKSAIGSMSDVRDAIEMSISQAGTRAARLDADVPRDGDAIVLSPAQAEILHLMAEGLSNAGIAKRRGTSLRAAESLVQRTFQALGVDSDPEYNSRVVAVRMWQQGKILVR